MRILAVSDLHFGLGQFDWLVAQAGSYDAVVIAGDLLDIAGHLDLDSQIIVVAKYLQAISSRTRLLVCSGNHDGDVKDEAQEFVARWLQRVRATGLVVNGGSTRCGNVKLTVCPWWDGPVARTALRSFLRAEAADSGAAWLWLHHAPPYGVGVSWTGKEDAGDASLAETIGELQPHFVFAGHIHNSPFRAGGAWASRMGETWIFNAGRQLGTPPAFIELDLTRRTARWVSQAGEEEIQLDAVPAPGGGAH